MASAGTGPRRAFPHLLPQDTCGHYCETTTKAQTRAHERRRPWGWMGTDVSLRKGLCSPKPSLGDVHTRGRTGLVHGPRTVLGGSAGTQLPTQFALLSQGQVQWGQWLCYIGQEGSGGQSTDGGQCKGGHRQGTAGGSGREGGERLGHVTHLRPLSDAPPGLTRPGQLS